MYISSLKIKNYRSVESISIKLDKLNILCGPNSSGKSNILRAIALAFQVLPEDKGFIEKLVRDNLSKNKLSSSAPIIVEVVFSQALSSVYTLASESKLRPVIYKFKATKSGNITRKLGNNSLDNEEFKKMLSIFSVVYIPTIRDLDNNGLAPFRDLFKRAIQNNRGGREMKSHLTGIKGTLSKKAAGILGEQKDIAQRVLNAKSIELSTDQISLDYIYDNLTLQIKNSVKSSMPMENIGTGHQSAVIINLYKQFGQSLEGKTLYLFEEPDAHLHPPTVREVGSQLAEISDRSQVLITTHSPILISHIGLDRVLHLKHGQSEGTAVFPTDIDSDGQNKIGHKLLKYGLRITEALFTKLVVLVEGPTDAIVLGRLIEKKTGKNCDQLDILIVPAGGKENIVEIADVLQKLSVSWKAIFDYDAAITTSAIPLTDGRYEIGENEEHLDKLDELIDCLNITEKRGRKAFTQFNNVKLEIMNGTPMKKYYDNSTLELLLNSVFSISVTKSATLKSAIKNEKVQIIRKILSYYGVWLMRPDLERTLAGKTFGNASVIDKVIRKNTGFKVKPEDPNYHKSMINFLHSLNRNPEMLVDVVDSVYASGGLARTDLNMAVGEICDFIS